MMLFTPESPRWLLLNKNDEQGARTIFEISGANADELIHEIKNTITPKKNPCSPVSFQNHCYWLFVGILQSTVRY